MQHLTTHTTHTTRTPCKVVFLASEVARGRSIYPDEMMIYSDTAGDDTYPSHVMKGMMGLVHMAERFPDAKWYAVLGDDVAVSVLAGNRNFTRQIRDLTPRFRLLYSVKFQHVLTKFMKLRYPR
jgi:hypothetical protein